MSDWDYCSKCSTTGTCPVCGNESVRLRSDGKTLGTHSAPRHVYKDGRGCKGIGLRCVEARKRPYSGYRYPVSDGGEDRP